MHRFIFRIRFPALALFFLLLAAGPAAAKKSKKGDGRPGKSLAETVEGTEEIAGLVTFYRSPQKLYLRVPEELVGTPLGLSATLVHAVGDWAVRGSDIETAVVTWEAAGERLVLTKKNLHFRADPASPIRPAVDSTFPDSPVFSGRRIELTDEARPWLIDAKGLFGPELVQILPRQAGYFAKPDDGILVSLKAFPDNVVARVVYRFRRKEGDGSRTPGSPFARFLGPGRLADPRSVEVTVDYHLYRLPSDGYRPRPADERVGGFAIPYKDYTGIDDRDTAFRHLLVRWDVRKQDPAAAISPAAEPITFYIDRSVPAEWRPLVRDATLWWNRAFEEVGIRDAIRVLDQPADPDWDPADLRHSMIYWNLSDDLLFSGLAGPSIYDPRTGKVLKANAYLNGEFPSFSLHRYLVYAWWRAPDPGEGETGAGLPTPAALRSLRRNPFFCDRAASFSSQIAFARLVLQSRGILMPGTAGSDRFAKEAFAELVAHEVGHALGFPHNWKASLISDGDAVASGDVDGRNGPRVVSASVMDYNPIYLAPRGAEQGDYFLRELGPYDYLSVEYLYRPFDGLSPGEEARELDAIAATAETAPGLIFDSGVLGATDPTASSDDLGDDPLGFAEARFGMVRDEVLPRLRELVLEEGHDYNLLRQALDAAIFSVVMDYIDLAARHVGGQILLRRVADSAAAPDGGPPPVRPVEPAEQRRALDILERNLFADGAFPISPDLLAALKADLLFDWNYPWRYASDYNVSTRIAGLYEAALKTLLDPGRLARILDNERRSGAGEDPLTLPELFDRLEQAAFGGGEGAAIGVDRRALQRLLVSHLIRLALNPAPGAPAEAGQVAAHTLRSIGRRVERRLERGGGAGLDGYTRAHLEDLEVRVRRALEAETHLAAGP